MKKIKKFSLMKKKLYKLFKDNKQKLLNTAREGVNCGQLKSFKNRDRFQG
jgi:hypothetical protein